jgi:hypothetical protein
VEDVSGVELKFLCVGVDSGGDTFEGVELLGKFDFHGVEEGLTVALEFFEEFLVDFFERFDIDDVAFIIDYVVHLTLIGIECLSFFLVLVEPFTLNRLAHGSEHVFDAFQTFAKPIGEPRETAKGYFAVLGVGYFVKLFH